ncbi:META domain-containing protein [Uruburuella testudinis]|uniref:META domain-containing protein n=1 Tax=Uruburuella testudinis TaxID=1282863 RepID=A0ABY4DRU8_9NEIS|nr:META domain-containing protein [Uruburuella testudinis]UOO81638.1 META domain-containing protein [Uruburuella testudinis]
MKFTAPLLLLLLTACVAPVVIPVPAQPARVQQLYGQWQITGLAGQTIRDSRAVFSVDSANPQFSAQTDCNQVFGRYSLDAGKQALSFSNIAATRMACAQDDIERTVVQVLPNVRRYRIENGSLNMLDAQGKVLLQGKRLK